MKIQNHLNFTLKLFKKPKVLFYIAWTENMTKFAMLPKNGLANGQFYKVQKINHFQYYWLTKQDWFWLGTLSSFSLFWHSKLSDRWSSRKAEPTKDTCFSLSDGDEWRFRTAALLYRGVFHCCWILTQLSPCWFVMMHGNTIMILISIGVGGTISLLYPIFFYKIKF
jgi:hypothetical protein